MKHASKRFMMVTLCMVVSLAALGLASFAWFTMSTNPEVRGITFTVAANDDLLVSSDGEEFGYTTDISEKISPENDETMATLRPVSTLDGVHWYVCDYEARGGNIVEDEFFLLEDYGHNNGFYAYTDIWLKSIGGTTVRLSTPAENAMGVEDEEYSGSYALSFVSEENEDGNGYTIKLVDEGPETCLRVGMMVLNKGVSQSDATPVIKTGDGSDVEKFFIYEPNADSRSQLDKSSNEYRTDIYVSGWKSKALTGENTYGNLQNHYIPTYPIKAKNGDPVISPSSADKDESEGGSTGQPAKVTKKVDALPTVMDLDNLIVQSTSSWNTEELTSPSNVRVSKLSDLFTTASPSDGEEGTVSVLNRKYLNLGAFVPKETIQSVLYSGSNAVGTQLQVGVPSYQVNRGYKPVNFGTEEKPAYATSATSQPLLTLEDGEVRQIRLFFWLEGQDVDCWNDVAGMNFLVRLEFAGHDE